LYAERAKDIFSKILLDHPDNKKVATRAYVGKADVYLKQKEKDLARAMQYANKAIMANEENGDAYRVLGMVYSLKGEHDKAIGYFDEATVELRIMRKGTKTGP